MSKHTPGPWFVADWTCFDGDNLLTVEAREPEITEAGQSGIWPDGIRKMKVASTDDGSFDRSTNLANARLIAAAPEMYEALQMFLAYNDQGGPLHFDTDAMWAKARSVMAKIEGGGDE